RRGPRVQAWRSGGLLLDADRRLLRCALDAGGSAGAATDDDPGFTRGGDFHAAGGVGLILCQWAKHLGATVIGTVGTEQKAEIARAHGCDATIVYSTEDFVGAVERLTHGRGVAVVFDSVGKDTFEKSL